MRLEQIDDDSYLVFVNNLYFKIDDFSDKQNLAKTIKNLLTKLSDYYMLSFKGYYKVVIYNHEAIGSYLVIDKMEDFLVDVTTVDIRVIAYLNEKFFIEFDNYEMIPVGLSGYFYNDKYYIDVDFCESEELIKLFDYGKVIYGSVVDNIKRFGNKIKATVL